MSRKEIMRIYVGNLSYDVTDSDLEQAFCEFGNVTSATVLIDKQTGRSKGFGFVEMPEVSEGQAAIKELDGKELKGRELKVDQAKDKPAQRPGGGRGGFNPRRGGSSSGSGGGSRSGGGKKFGDRGGYRGNR